MSFIVGIIAKITALKPQVFSAGLITFVPASSTVCVCGASKIFASGAFLAVTKYEGASWGQRKCRGRLDVHVRNNVTIPG